MSKFDRSSGRSTLNRAYQLTSNPFLAYGLIIALQLRVVWNIWRYKDLTAGDTSSYFLDATSWAHGLHDDIVWSPLYTDFFGSVDAVIRPVYTALMIHHLAIVFAAALLVLALMRSLLGSAMGLLVTVWWVMLPPNFNVQYEIHLFGLLPILIAALVVARKPGRMALGVAFAVLAGGAILVRNEQLIATIIVGLAILARELRERRVKRVPATTYWRAYAPPLVILCLLVGGSYWRSFDQGHEAEAAFTAKQDLNMCQVYATNFQQRYPERFTNNPFTECSPLLKQTFGRPMVSLIQAVSANPRAVAAMVGWNALLLPGGVQVALFNATATGNDPDYFPVKEHRLYPLVLSIIALFILIGGCVALSRDREFWRRKWLPPRAWAITVLAAVAFTDLIVALTQRPRPEYIYGLTVGLMALIGLCSLGLLRRINGTRFIGPITIILILVLITALPSYYTRGHRPILDAVNRMQVVRSALREPGAVLIAAESNFEICSYLGETYLRHCTSPSWTTIGTELSAAGASTAKVMNRAHATVIYAESLLLENLAIAKLVADPAQAGWKQVAGGDSASGPWHVLVRAS